MDSVTSLRDVPGARERVVMKAGLWATVCMTLWLSSGAAWAQQAPASPSPTPAPGSSDEVARGLFQAGKAAYEGGNYTEALSFFEQAYQRSGRPQLLFNIGQVADRLRQDDKALESFRTYLAQVPEAPNRIEVESRIAAIEQALAERKAAADAAAVPTPAETAAQSTAVQPDSGHTDADKPITHKWWFWTSIGGAVAVAVVVIAVTAGGGDGGGTEPLFEGSGGSFPGP
jgi:outer membrane protein assembly factor BamD (BamD/ComL family)